MKDVDKNSIVNRFINQEKLRYIAEDFGVTPARIGQIIYEKLDRKKIDYIKKLKKIARAQRRKIIAFERYHTDEKYREEIKKKNLNRYHNKKI